MTIMGTNCMSYVTLVMKIVDKYGITLDQIAVIEAMSDTQIYVE